MDIKELATLTAAEMDDIYLRNVPAIVLEQYATRLIAAYTEGQEPDESQNWKGMSGAVAWHLIDRHGEDWADIGNKMDAWLKANTAPPLPAIPDERIATLEQQRDELLAALVKAADFIQPYNVASELLEELDAAIAKVKQP